MFGVEMDAPKGKLPGFYAQAIRRIGDAVRVFDRDKQLLIVEREEDREKLIAILDCYGMAGERFDLWLLPEGTDASRLGDYGFVSASGRAYLYADLVAFFRLDPSAGTPEDRWAALEQMKEYLIASLPGARGDHLHAVDRDQRELMEKIARAYGAPLVWTGS